MIKMMTSNLEERFDYLIPVIFHHLPSSLLTQQIHSENQVDRNSASNFGFGFPHQFYVVKNIYNSMLSVEYLQNGKVQLSLRSLKRAAQVRQLNSSFFLKKRMNVIISLDSSIMFVILVAKLL